MNGINVKSDWLNLWIQNCLIKTGCKAPHFAYSPDNGYLSPLWHQIIGWLDGIDTDQIDHNSLDLDRAQLLWIESHKFIGIDLGNKQDYERVIDIGNNTYWQIDHMRIALALERDRYEWCVLEEMRNHLVIFNVQGCLFQMDFVSGDKKNWQMRWSNMQTIPEGSGLFASVIDQVRYLTQIFMENTFFEDLVILGSDQKRTQYYLSECYKWTPLGVGITTVYSDLGEAKGIKFVSLNNHTPDQNILYSDFTGGLHK